MNLTQLLVFVIVALVMGWYAAGVIFNIRRGNAVLKWMQAGLPRLGERTTLRWLGSSAVELGIGKAKAPFRRAEIVLVLEPRYVPWFWLAANSSGRRDMLILRGQLASAPQYEYDVLAPGSWSERQRQKRAAGRDWPVETLEASGGPTLLRAPSATLALARQAAPRALEAARRVRPMVWCLSARREYPQIELHIPLPDPQRDDAQKFFAALRALAESMGSGP